MNFPIDANCVAWPLWLCLAYTVIMPLYVCVYVSITGVVMHVFLCLVSCGPRSKRKRAICTEVR